MTMEERPSGAMRLLHEPWPAGGGLLVLAENAEAAGDLGIGLDEAAEILAEAVLVKLVGGFGVPQPARVGRDLVGDDDAHHVALPQAPDLHLEVDEADADAEEEPRQEVVDPDGEGHDVVDFLR